MKELIKRIQKRTLQIDMSDCNWGEGVALWGINHTMDEVPCEEYIPFLEKWVKKGIEGGKFLHTVNNSIPCVGMGEVYKRTGDKALLDMMIEQGLLDECRRLMDAGVFERSATAAQAIGYKELFPYLRGELSLESCVETLKMATRRYAKRQMTWFRMHGNVVWLDREAGMSERDLITLATDRAYDFLKA